ncbi:MAG TPA: hypothetical protein VI138_00250 [Candidatus Dormibacteraeota bacterium]
MAELDPRALMAARNNASWCDLVCRAHRLTTQFQEACWVQGSATLPLYPNLITLDQEGSERQIGALDRLRASSLAEPWSVKDSFSSLPLSTRGFSLLFEAQWIWRPSAQGPGRTEPSRTQVLVVRSPDQLGAWETAWDGAPPQWASRRLFPDPLLASPDLLFLAVGEDREMEAGAIASRFDGAIGISNVFPEAVPEDLLEACLGHAERTWPGLPLVGYERGEDLARMERLGFERTGALRVWQTS